MKRFSVLLMFLLLIGCSKGNVEIEMTKSPSPEEMTDVEFTIMSKNAEVQDFKGTAEFRMIDMDHGSEVTDLEHLEGAEYKGQVNLPMSGDWSIDIVGESEEFGKIDKTIEVSVE